jgi:hypothetical protein
MYWQSLWLEPRSRFAGLRGSFFADAVTEERPMATALKNAQQRAAAAAKEERARDAAQAMRDYEAEQFALRANTARLRALRLAQEAGKTRDAKAQQPAKKIA